MSRRREAAGRSWEVVSCLTPFSLISIDFGSHNTQETLITDESQKSIRVAFVRHFHRTNLVEELYCSSLHLESFHMTFKKLERMDREHSACQRLFHGRFASWSATDWWQEDSMQLQFLPLSGGTFRALVEKRSRRTRANHGRVICRRG